MKVNKYCIFYLEKKSKEEEQAQKKKEKEEKQAKKQMNSQLTQIKFLIKGVLFVKQYLSYNLNY